MQVMWRRLAGVFLCAAGVVWADVCEGLPSAPTSGASSFRLANKNGPSFRIAIRSTGPSAGEIEVSRCQDGKQLQVLPITSQQPSDFARSFHAEDINFDGYLDFAVLIAFGGAWGSEQWWVYDPSTGRFVQNELTRAIAELKAADYTFDPEKHELRTRYLTEPWGCGPTGDRYRIQNNRLLLIHKEKPKPATNACRVVISDLVNGTMRVTAVKRYAGGQPVK